MATRRQCEAAAPPPLQAANAAPARPAAMEGDSLSRIMRDSFSRIMRDSFSRIMEDFQRLRAAINQLDSERAEKEAEVQKVMEELESEKAHKAAQVQKVMKLESEKAQKEAQFQKVMEENVRLHAMLDKEAQLQAMSEQCKFMALNHHN